MSVTFDEKKEIVKSEMLFKEKFAELYPDKAIKGKMCICPFHSGGFEKNPSMQINTDNGYCYTCGKSYDVIDLYQNLYDTDFRTAVNNLYDGINTTKSKTNKNIKIEEIVQVKDFSESFNTYLSESTGPSVQLTEILKQRNIHDLMINLYKEKKIAIVDEKIFIPHRNSENDITGIQKIDLLASKGKYRYMNEKDTTVGVFVIEKNQQYPYVAVESIIDGLSIHAIDELSEYNIIVLTTCHNYLKLQDKMFTGKKIIMALDNDDSGRSATERTGMLNITGLSRVNWEKHTGCEKYDLNDLLCNGKESILTDLILNPVKMEMQIEASSEESPVDASLKFISDKGKIIPNELAAEFIDKYHVKGVKNHRHSIYLYTGKIYEQTIERDMIHRCFSMVDEEKYKDQITTANINAVKAYIPIRMGLVSGAGEAHYLTFKNGILDIRSMDFCDHTPEIFTTNILDFDYKKDLTLDKDSVHFKEYIKTTFPDHETQKYVQEIFGYIFHLQLPTPFLCLCHGSKGTGKSTLLNIIESIVGEENRSTLSLSNMNERFSNYALKNKMVNLCGEVEQTRGMKLDTLKKITSGDPISVEQKGKDAETICCYAKNFFACNTFPFETEGRDERNSSQMASLFDRIYFIPFEITFRGTSGEKKNLISLIKEERSVIINWALEGLDRLRANNFTFNVPNKVELLKKSIMKSSDGIFDFIETHLVVSAGEKVKFKDAYESYKQYCRMNRDLPELKKSQFKSALQSHSIHVKNGTGNCTFVYDYTLL